MKTSTSTKGAYSQQWPGLPRTAYEATLSTQSNNNRLLIANMEMRAGEEPPRHLHEKEDEVFILLEGSIKVFRGDEIFEAHAGDLVWLPRMVPHHYQLLTEKIKAIFLATPGHIGGYFNELSQEADEGAISISKAPAEKILAYVKTKMPGYSVYYV
jgi:mannose-6-phosphate isomerase-like protein (cupin superfamily)